MRCCGVGRYRVDRGDGRASGVRALRLDVGLRKRIRELLVVGRPRPCRFEPRDRLGEFANDDRGKPEDLFRLPARQRVRWQTIDDGRQERDGFGGIVRVIVSNAEQEIDLRLQCGVGARFQRQELFDGLARFPIVDQPPCVGESALGPLGQGEYQQQRQRADHGVPVLAGSGRPVPSVSVTIRFGSTPVHTSAFPFGHRTSTRSIVLADPRPKCSRRSFWE